MKKIFCFLTLIALPLSVAAQDTTSTAQPETFDFEWNDQTYKMQKYFIVFLKRGPVQDQRKEEAANIQNAHLAYLGGLYEEGIINLNGPTDGEGDIRGFSVYNVPTIEDAIRYASNDPAVKAGRLIIEAHPWWLAKGSGVK